jgi:hypothetical protein
VAWRDPWQPIFEGLAEGVYLDGGVDLFSWVEDVEEALAAVRARLSPTVRHVAEAPDRR